MRLCCQLPQRLPRDTATIFSRLLEKEFELVKRADTQVIVKEPRISLPTVEQLCSLGLRFLNDREVLKSIIEAGRDFDGIVVACYADPALKAARQLLRIPIIGIGEASMHFASFMGQKFAIITSDARFVPEIVENLRIYGMEANSITRKPVRSLTVSEAELAASLQGDSKVISNFKEVARECIEDDADVLINGCGLVSPVLTLSGVTEVDHVPIVDPILVSIKMAEILVDLKKANIPIISGKGLYTATPKELIEETMKKIFK